MPAKPKTYVSTYCNFAHRMSTGRPIGHECIVIPPAALEAEREGDFDKAIAILQRSSRRPVGGRARSVGGEGSPDYYRVVRFYFSHPSGASRRVLKPRVTLAVAQAHTHNNPESSSSTAKSAAARRLTKRVGAWFDGYEGVYVKRRGSRRRVGSTSSRRSLVSATHTKAAEAKVRSAAFARFGRKRKDVFFEHGQWFVRLDPLGESTDYSVVDTSRGLDFEQL